MMVWNRSGCKNEEKKELTQEATVSPKLAADWLWMLEGGRNERWQGFEPE